MIERSGALGVYQVDVPQKRASVSQPLVLIP
jgi:hypothetical protein